jgi:hypothetical protein
MLNIRTQGIQGKTLSNFKEVGFVEVRPEYSINRITFDDFEGDGNAYHRRKQTHIRILEDKDVIFEGTFYDLINILKPIL